MPVNRSLLDAVEELESEKNERQAEKEEHERELEEEKNRHAAEIQQERQRRNEQQQQSMEYNRRQRSTFVDAQTLSSARHLEEMAEKESEIEKLKKELDESQDRHDNEIQSLCLSVRINVLVAKEHALRPSVLLEERQNREKINEFAALLLQKHQCETQISTFITYHLLMLMMLLL